ncbi:MAG TPA: CAP domain-containing protein [Pyrinomonadaceae bacterium]|nr:CAP domain-containing protein [Pyrinomonadaceae bacterium]
MSRLVPISAFLLVILCQTAFAQDGRSQSVARLITSLTPVTARPANLTPLEPNDIEKRAFEQTNIVRVKNGLAPLVWDADVCRMARIHSESMSRQGYFSHVTPDGLRLRERARIVGIYQYAVLGENIAYNQGYDDPGAFAVERWMQSEKHRANILSSEFRAMAIGSFVAPDGSVYLTQTFITR